MRYVILVTKLSAQFFKAVETMHYKINIKDCNHLLMLFFFFVCVQQRYGLSQVIKCFLEKKKLSAQPSLPIKRN